MRQEVLFGALLVFSSLFQGITGTDNGTGTPPSSEAGPGDADLITGGASRGSQFVGETGETTNGAGAVVPMEALRYFTRNAGQLPESEIHFYSSPGGTQAGFAESRVVFMLPSRSAGAQDPLFLPLLPLGGGDDGRGGSEPAGSERVTLSFAGSRQVQPVGRSPLSHPTSFFYGDDPLQWISEVESYREIAYADLYDGIDLVYRMSSGGLKYEFVLAPGADPGAIEFVYGGASSVEVTPEGGLAVQTRSGALNDASPIALQQGEQPVCRFEKRASLSVGFACTSWAPDKSWLLDPLIFATYLGGSGEDGYFDATLARVRVAVDPTGGVVLAGVTGSLDFPNSSGSATTEGFLLKLDASGSEIEYAAFFGGSGTDAVQSIALDSSGRAVVVGSTDSPNFPVTAGAYSTNRQGPSDGFVLRFNANASALDFGTFIGAAGGTQSDVVFSAAVGTDGGVYLTGTGSPPATAGSFDATENGNGDAWVAKLNASGQTMDWLGYLGGTADDWGSGIALDAAGSVYVCGYTRSADFPATLGANDTSYNGNSDLFVAKVNASGTEIVYATFVGGSGVESRTTAQPIAVDSSGGAYVVGDTGSSDFPTTPGALSQTIGGFRDAVLFAIDPSGQSLLYSTFVGGSSNDAGRSIALDPLGRVVIGGFTSSTDFPTTPGASDLALGGTIDGFLSVINVSGGSLDYSTFFGGSGPDNGTSVGLDPDGNAVLVGMTNSTDLPAFGNDTTANGGTDVFVAKFEISGNLARHNVTIDTSPSGFQVEVAGFSVATPYTYACFEGTSRLVAAPPVIPGNSTRYVFVNWSDTGAADHRVSCSAETVVTAYFSLEYAADLTTSPPGLQLLVDGAATPTPQQLWWASGSSHVLQPLDPQAQGAVEYGFVGWSDGGSTNNTVVALGPTSITATFSPVRFRVDVATNPPGLGLVVDGSAVTSPSSFWWAAGSAHSIDAPSPQAEQGNTRLAFDGWPSGSNGALQVTADAAQRIEANFTLEYAFDLNTQPGGLELTIDGQTAATPLTVWWRESSTHTVGIPASAQTSVDGLSRLAFAAWSDGGAREHDVTVSAPGSLLATMAPSEFLVTLDTSPTGLRLLAGGSPVIAPASIWWPANAALTVAAPTPQVAVGVRQVFSQWSDGGSANHSIAVVGPGALTAFYTTEFEVVVDAGIPGLQLLVDGASYGAPRSFWWASGSRHAIGARSPQAIEFGVQARWDGWSDAGPQNHSLDVVAPLSLVASFKLQYLVNVLSLYGTPACDVAGCWYDEGTVATVSASPIVDGAPGIRYRFAGWAGAQNPQETTLSITVSGTVDVTATWVTQYSLQLDSQYGNTTGAGWYDAGAVASVSVSPTEWREDGRLFRFQGWTGANGLEAGANIDFAVGGPTTLVASWIEVRQTVPMDFGLYALLAGGGLSAAFALAYLRSRGRREEAGEGAGAVGPQPEVDATRILPADTSPYSQISACPQCGAGVVVGSAECAACGLKLMWY